MMPGLSILYRGPLRSCNYGCTYCPFARHRDTADELQADQNALARFTQWVEQQDHRPFSIFFTPWGEALIRPWYQQAICGLSHLPRVQKVAIQTNLSGSLKWLTRAERSKLGIWATYHPGEVPRRKFVAHCRRLEEAGVRFSVGVVGLKEHETEIKALRRELPPTIYVWINAYKRQPDYYTPEHRDAFTRIDSLFPINNQHHPSLGRPCHAGHDVISVDGEGVARRCHFIKAPIGNIFDPHFLESLSPAPVACTQATCGCHIGYVHMLHLGLDSVFGDGLLERIPAAYATISR
jgi:MoaA/NifB/PqqE/SkfB family radical SAM enzyme